MSERVPCGCGRDIETEPNACRGVQAFGPIDDGGPDEPPLALFNCCACGTTRAAPVGHLLHDDGGLR